MGGGGGGVVRSAKGVEVEVGRDDDIVGCNVVLSAELESLGSFLGGGIWKMLCQMCTIISHPDYISVSCFQIDLDRLQSTFLLNRLPRSSVELKAQCWDQS